MQTATTWESDRTDPYLSSLAPALDGAEFVTEKSRPALLDSIVARAHQLTVFRVRYHPYFAMSDAAAVSALLYARIFASRFPQMSAAALAFAILLALAIYKVVLEVKAALRKTAARSVLQDCVMIIIPCFLLVCGLLKQPLDLTLAFLGTLLPLYGCLARVGCFLGGCCYGKPSSLGVLYPESIFVPTSVGYRRYAPSPDPGVRVFPIQLVEAAVQGILFASLAALVWRHPSAASSVFWLYLALYAIIRFGLDFYRSTSARPRCGRFSHAQLACLVVLTVALTVLCF